MQYLCLLYHIISRKHRITMLLNFYDTEIFAARFVISAFLFVIPEFSLSVPCVTLFYCHPELVSGSRDKFR